MDSFIRWQGRTIKQLSHANSLILALSLATLGFQASQLLDNRFVLSGLEKPAFLFSLTFNFLSLCSGIFVVINRLHDFRKSANIARNRNGSDPIRIAAERAEAASLGEGTWKLFRLQIFLFFAAVVLIVIDIGAIYFDKLF